MSREEFLLKLKKYLKRLPEDEASNAIRYYEEYLDDVGASNEANTIATLGNPYKIASQITAEYAVKDMEEAPSAKKVFPTIWVVLLAAFASPIAIPLVLAIFFVAFALVIVVFSLVLSLAVIALSFALCGIVCVLVGVCLIAQSLAATIFYLGAGLFLLGAGVLISLLVIMLSKKGFSGMTKMISKWLPRRVQNAEQ